jgi:hypothetical protein
MIEKDRSQRGYDWRTTALEERNACRFAPTQFRCSCQKSTSALRHTATTTSAIFAASTTSTNETERGLRSKEHNRADWRSTLRYTRDVEVSQSELIADNEAPAIGQFALEDLERGGKPGKCSGDDLLVRHDAEPAFPP